MLIGLVEIFRSRDEGMIELELSLTYSPSDLMLSKLAIVGFFNLACNLLLIVVINFFAEPIVLIELLKYWAVPYLFSSPSVCFYQSSYVLFSRHPSQLLFYSHWGYLLHSLKLFTMQYQICFLSRCSFVQYSQLV